MSANTQSEVYAYHVESKQSIPRQLEADQMVEEIASFLRQQMYDPQVSPRSYDHGDRYLDAVVTLSRPLDSGDKEFLTRRFHVRIEL